MAKEAGGKRPGQFSAPTSRRHVRLVFDRAKAEWDQRPTADWLQAYGCELGNLRAALDWAFSKEGDGAGRRDNRRCGTALVSSSLLDEGLSRVEHAIAWLKDEPTPDRRLMMHLYAISGWPQMRAIKAFPDGTAAWREDPGLAIELDDVDYQLPGDLGALGRPHQPWRGYGGSRPRRPLCRPRGTRHGFTGSYDRTTDAREILALLGGFRWITPKIEQMLSATRHRRNDRTSSGSNSTND